MKIVADASVARIAVECPLATRVFERHGIDYCCSGGRPLRQACEERGLDSEAVLEEIERELSASTAPVERWDDAPVDALVDHILESFHQPLRRELPRLESMARKVIDAHLDKEPVMLPKVLSVFSELRAELEAHMAKEEQILFPMIKRGGGRMAGGPISVMRHEHDSAGAALDRLRGLTEDYRTHPEACATWKAFWHGLEALEEALHQHIHLENNILFPRVLPEAPGSVGP